MPTFYEVSPAPVAMHAPDGFFSTPLAVLGWVIAVVLIGIALRQTREQLGEKQVPLMGVLAAAIFAGQMINFTIPGGTSGHLLGGALAAILLGPWAGLLVIATVVAVQALLFQDGGLLVMGLNIINMGIITSFTGYFVHRWITKGKPDARGRQMAGAFAAGWVSLIVTAAFAAVELALSGTSPLGFALPAMVGVHAMIGIGEGLITAAAVGFVLAARPDLVSGADAPGQRGARWVLVGLGIALAITLIAPLASPYSDGMERIAEAFYAPAEVENTPVGFNVPDTPQFFGEFRDAPYELLPDYTVPVLGDGGISTIAAGGIGVLMVFVLAWGAARLIRPQPTADSTP